MKRKFDDIADDVDERQIKKRKLENIVVDVNHEDDDDVEVLTKSIKRKREDEVISDRPFKRQKTDLDDDFFILQKLNKIYEERIVSLIKENDDLKYNFYIKQNLNHNDFLVSQL